MTNEEAKMFLDNLKICINEHPVVADWLVEIADRKTEPTTEDWQDWKDRMWAEAIVTEPTISKMEQVDKDINVRSKDEPQTNADQHVQHVESVEPMQTGREGEQMTYTEKELDQFLHGISLSLLSKKSAQHWRYGEETAKEIEWLEVLERKVRADKADRKTENSSEKPNNCEHITEDGVTCAKYPACDDCLDNPLNKVKGSKRLIKGKEQTEPTISKMEQVDKDINVRSKDEPQTCDTCKYGEDKHRYAHICNECGVGINNYEPKDEPQTDCPWK